MEKKIEKGNNENPNKLYEQHKGNTRVDVCNNLSFQDQN